MKAPIATTTKIVPKKIVAEPVRFHHIRRQNAGEKPDGRFAEDVPSPAQCRRELLGDIDPRGGEGGQHRKTGDQRAGDHDERLKSPRPMRHQHQEEAGERSGERIGDRPAPPDETAARPKRARRTMAG